jgi:hypothetical protein
MERAARLQGLFCYMPFKFQIKISLNKESFFPFLKGPGKGAYLHVPQQRGPYGNRRPFPEPYLAYPLGSPVKEPPFRFPSQSSLGERCSLPRALHHSTFKVPSMRTPFQVPQRGPYGERCPSPEPSFTHPPGSPVKEPPLQVHLTEFPQRLSTSRAPFIHPCG